MVPVSFVFDDGFTASCLKIADIFERWGLAATFAVLVNPEGFKVEVPKGDFGLWNELQDRGHLIHPHGWDHTDLTQIPLAEAKEKVNACLDGFSQRLNGFDTRKSIYHLTYNRSTPEVNDYLLSRVAAIRTNSVESALGDGLHTQAEWNSRIFRCGGFGPDSCDTDLHRVLSRAEEEQPVFVYYMMHGLDGEGWGPVSSGALESALGKIQQSPVLTYQINPLIS